MTRDAPRLFVPVDVNFDDDSKIIDAGPWGELVYQRLLRLAKRLQSDGFVSHAQVRKATSDLAALGSEWETAVDDLVRVGLLSSDDDGVWIVAWLKHNPSRDELDAARDADAERKRKWRDKQKRDAASPEPVSPATERDDGRDELSRVADRRATRSEENGNVNGNSPPGGALTAPPTNVVDLVSPEPTSTQRLVAGYVAAYRDRHGGRDPSSAWRSQAGKAVAAALAEGEDPDDIERCLGAMVNEGKAPGVLNHVLSDYHRTVPA